MLDADERHWWYRGRRRVVEAALERHAGLRRGRALDVGCGSGRTLDDLSSRGPAAGVDAAPAAVAAARARGHRDVHLGRAEALPFGDGAFELVTCLDVLEHIADDAGTLRELRRVTAPGGHLLLTVPAYPALWSAHDVRNHHRRRYRRADLRRLAPAAGWEVVELTHFNAALLAPAAAVRLAVRGDDDGRSDLDRTPPWADPLLERVLAGEAALLRRGVRLPFGLSILAVLRAGDAPALPTAAGGITSPP